MALAPGRRLVSPEGKVLTQERVAATTLAPPAWLPKKVATFGSVKPAEFAHDAPPLAGLQRTSSIPLEEGKSSLGMSPVIQPGDPRFGMWKAYQGGRKRRRTARKRITRKRRSTKKWTSSATRKRN